MSDKTLPEIASDQLADLLRQLVQIDSCNPPGLEKPVADLLADVMQEAGLEVTLLDFAPQRANVVGRWRGTGAKPALLLNGHLDTVPVDKTQWRHDPHAGVIEGDVLHGRGTVDMKGGVAAMVMACVALARAGIRLEGDLIFAGTAGEEVNCIGAQELLKQDLGPIAALVVGEPTHLEVVAAHKGALWLEITTTGKAAHGSMPEQGNNAIVAMHRLMERLLAYRPEFRAHPLLGPPTTNLGTIQGGAKTNIVADRCVLTLDLRTVPGQNHKTLIADIQTMVDALAQEDPGIRAKLRVLTDRTPVETPLDEALIQSALRVGSQVLGRSLTPRGVSYFSDASVLTPALDVPTLIFGPGDQRLAHQVNEQTELSAVLSAAYFYAALGQSFFTV